MGKTNQKLTIWVAEEWADHAEMDALRDKGHEIFPLTGVGNLPAPDLILHPAAHQWSDYMWGYLENALKAARKRKYPKKRKAA